MTTKRISPLRVLGVVVAALLIVCALIYIAGVVFFRTHFPFHTTFLDYDVSERDVTAIDDCMRRESEARTLTVIDRDGGSETLNLAEAVGYRRTVPEPSRGWINADESWTWPLRLGENTTLVGDVSISYDEDMLAAAVDRLAVMDPANMTPPQDAYLEWQDGILVLIPEVDGNELDRGKVIELLRRAIESDESAVDLAAGDCYLAPDVRSDDEELGRTLAKYQSINFQRLDIDMTGLTVTLTPDDILSLHTQIPHSDRYILSLDAVREFTQRLKDEYDTYESKRPFVNHYGNTIEVGTAADTYGFRMDYDATLELLTDALRSKKSQTISPVWIHEGLDRQENGSDIGDTYIEVTIDGQHLWAYQNGQEILSCDVVTGTRNSRDTPRGVFSILNTKYGATLVGEDYETYVSYWMPITWSGVGLHDASWRGNFGGSIYTYSGSHGCVNLPTWAARELIETYSAGTPVVIW